MARKYFDPNKAGILFTIISILSPTTFMFHPPVEGYPPHFTIYTILYTFDYVHGYSYFILPPIISILAMLAFSAPRFAFVYFVYRLYSGATTYSRVKQMGVIAEIGIIILSFIFDLQTIVSLILGGWMTSLMFPVPIPLLVFMIFHKIKPGPEGDIWEPSPEVQSFIQS